MSTIATPRDLPVRRISQTPTSSNRPSLDSTRSVSRSPNRGPSSVTSASTSVPGTPATAPAQNARRNRAALREYYNLKKQPGTPTLEITGAFGDTDEPNDLLSYSEVPASAMDAPDFDADAYVRQALQDNSLEALLRVYARVLSETRALDAEKKSLVYDNYSRLITATETIRKMRATMDPLNPMAKTLDPAMAHIYTQASTLRDAMRAAVPAPGSEAARQAKARAHTRQLAETALDTPARLRQLVQAGRTDEAKEAWKRPRRLLQIWLDQGVGGADEVAACLADGDAALKQAEAEEA